jgi:hypothetical protein
LGGTGRSRSDEFHPSLHPKRKEDQPDLPSIDPTLRLDLLAKVQNVKLDGGQRNLFQFGTMVAVVQPKGPEPIVKPIRPPMDYPRPYDTGPIIVKRDPVAPPFTPKYYGLATKRIDGKKTAFFLDGEDILLATEGMTVKSRFKLIRIDADSVVVQHLDFKSQQTVKISEDAGGTL